MKETGAMPSRIWFTRCVPMLLLKSKLYNCVFVVKKGLKLSLNVNLNWNVITKVLETLIFPSSYSSNTLNINRPSWLSTTFGILSLSTSKPSETVFLISQLDKLSLSCKLYGVYLSVYFSLNHVIPIGPVQLTFCTKLSDIPRINTILI